MFRIKAHTRQRRSEGSNKTCVHQEPRTPQETEGEPQLFYLHLDHGVRLPLWQLLRKVRMEKKGRKMLRRDDRLERKERDGEREGGGYNENRKREKSNEQERVIS